MDRLGLGAAAMRERNPRLVYVSINAYGERGPYAARGGVDVAIQAESGLMSITGEPEGPPTKVGSVPVDAAAGHVAAQGVMAALLGRARTGRGDVVRVSLYDVACGLHAHDFTDYLTQGWVARRQGNFPAATTPAGVYDTADGSIVLAAYMPHHWQVAVEIFDDDDLRTDPRFATMKERVKNRQVLLPKLQSIMRTRTTSEWMSAFAKGRITSGVVRDSAEAAESEQFDAAELAIEMTSEDGRSVRTIRTPVRLDSVPRKRSAPAPRMGSGLNPILAVDPA